MGEINNNFMYTYIITYMTPIHTDVGFQFTKKNLLMYINIGNLDIKNAADKEVLEKIIHEVDGASIKNIRLLNSEMPQMMKAEAFNEMVNMLNNDIQEVDEQGNKYMIVEIYNDSTVKAYVRATLPEDVEGG